MKKDFTESMKERMLEQRQEILDSLAGQSEQLHKLVETVESGDDVDIASDTIDRTLLNQLGAQDARRLQMIDATLDRIRMGTYGICVSCGTQIPEERLDAIPYAALCINCQEAEDKRNR